MSELVHKGEEYTARAFRLFMADCFAYFASRGVPLAEERYLGAWEELERLCREQVRAPILAEAFDGKLIDDDEDDDQCPETGEDRMRCDCNECGYNRLLYRAEARADEKRERMA